MNNVMNKIDKLTDWQIKIFFKENDSENQSLSDKTLLEQETPPPLISLTSKLIIHRF